MKVTAKTVKIALTMRLNKNQLISLSPLKELKL